MRYHTTTKLTGALLALALNVTLPAALRAEEKPAAKAADACCECDAAPEADRRAILSQAGEFAVDFHFEETLALKPEYKITSAYNEDARELVVVVEDSPRRIALQHLLLVGGGHVIQHWRQIWTYEDTRITEFQGLNRWKNRTLTSDEAKGTWSQMVTNVDNSPRYEGWGAWEHKHGISEWTSHDTWRPLPRREYSKRSDYDVVIGVNRHVLTPAGWAHEQDNTKLDLTPSGNRALAREFGLNQYRRAPLDELPGFSPAQDWWAKNSAASNELFAAWEEITSGRDSYALDDAVDTSKLRNELVKAAKIETPAERASSIRSVIASFLKDFDSVAAK